MKRYLIRYTERIAPRAVRSRTAEAQYATNASRTAAALSRNPDVIGTVEVVRRSDGKVIASFRSN